MGKKAKSMHNLGVFVHRKVLFLLKYLFISKKKVLLCTQIFN